MKKRGFSSKVSSSQKGILVAFLQFLYVKRRDIGVLQFLEVSRKNFRFVQQVSTVSVILQFLEVSRRNFDLIQQVSTVSTIL